MLIWQTSRRSLTFERPLVMAILNTTPDSFSDGGKFITLDNALEHAERLISEGADILDVGGESTRPGSTRIPADEESGRVCPVIEAIVKRFDIPVSVDTSKADVARRAVAAGAEIINDISGLRFDPEIAAVAARQKAGLLIMHSRGTFESLHTQPPLADVISDVVHGLRESIAAAVGSGVDKGHIAIDIGLGFGKTVDQNLELIAKLDKLTAEFPQFPMVVGASRKSFIGKVMNAPAVEDRLNGSLACAVTSVWNGANIVRVHDVRPTVEALRVVKAIRDQL